METKSNNKILQELFENLVLNFPSIELIKLNEDDFAHIYMPELYSNKSNGYLYFKIHKNQIEIGFYLNDKDLIKNLIRYSDKIEESEDGVTLKGNPLFEKDFEDVFDATITFIRTLKKCWESRLYDVSDLVSITEGLDDLKKFDFNDEKIIEIISNKIKTEKVIPELLFINEAFLEEDIEVNNHQAYFFTSTVLISDKELEGYLYVNMDGFYSNCLEDDMSFLVSWDVVHDIKIIQEDAGIEIEIKVDDGELTIKEESSKNLKILYSFYKNVWKNVADKFKNEPMIRWGEVSEMGIKKIDFESLEDYIIWAKE